MRKALLLFFILFGGCILHASAQDMRTPQDTAKIMETLRAGGVLGPIPFEYISWQDRNMTASPEAARMTKYADIPISNSLGQADINIPIYTVKTRSLTLPIVLSYDCSGIRPDEISGVVGLGWSLQAGGVITREIIARQDSGIIPPEFTSSSQSSSIMEYALQLKDTDYDRYRYSFCGHAGTFYIIPDIPSQTMAIVPGEPTDLTISKDNDGFLIVDKEGNQFRFSRTETSGRVYGSNDPNAPINNNPSLSYNSSTVTAWHLTEICSIDGADAITLSYEQLDGFSHVTHSYYRSVSFPYQYLGGGSYLTNFTGGWDPTPTFMTKEWSTTTTTTWHPYVVDTISFSGGTVSFAYEPYTLANPSANSDRRSYPSFLSSITVKNASNSTLFSWDFSKSVTGDNRTLLSSVTKKGSNGSQIESWSLDYNTPSTAMGENSVDLFGYYNGADNPFKSFLRPFNDTNTINFAVADRNPSSSAIGKLSLSAMTTSSGSKTRFYYTSKSISSDGLSNLFSSYISIGQAVSRIDTYDLSGGAETLVRSRHFSYSNPEITIPKWGFQMGAFISTTEYNSISSTGGQIPGYWYGPQSPIRVCSIVYSDQSNLPGAPLESAQIFYRTVEEDIYNNSSLEIKTIWEYDSTGAVSTGGGGPVWTPSDSHDNLHTPPGAVSNHFFQRVPTYIPRNGSQSNPTTPLGYHFRDQNRPQLANPVRITSYKKNENGQFSPVTQTDFSYETADMSVQTGLHASYKISCNVNGYENNTISCLEDFDQQQVDRKVVYQRLTERVEKEYLDDGNYRTVRTSYLYDYSPTDRTSLYSGNTYFSNTVQVPAMGAIQSPRQEIRVYDNDPARTYTRNIIFPDELVGVSGCGWAGTLNTRGYRSPVGEEIAVGTSATDKAGRYVIWGEIPISSWSGGTNSSTTLLRPSIWETFRGGVNVGPTTTISVIDSHGNPLQIDTQGQPVRTVAWGYNYMYPVAEITGASFSTVRGDPSSPQQSVLDGIGSAATLSSSQLTFLSVDLRALLPNALVSTYTHVPLIGMASSEDPSGRQMRYNYDWAGRLADVRDEDNYYVTSYSYALTNGGSGSPNRIESTDYTTASPIPSSGIREVSYYDGLGRTIQTVAVQAATLDRDLVTPVVPDFLDREDVRVYLPYPATTSSSNMGTYRSDAVSAQQTHYGSNIRAFTENTYEMSSRGRVVSSSLPGFTETTNTSTQGSATNTVLRINYNAGTNTISVSGYYDANRFTVTVIEGPDGSRQEIYNDELDTPALERVKLDASGTYAETYYVRDALGRPVCVIPPAESVKLSSGTSNYSASNCYAYSYDGRDRIVSRQLPGSAAEALTYTQADLPATRTRRVADGSSVDEVYTITYDTFNRPVQETYQYGSNSAVTLAEYWYDGYLSGMPTFSAESGYVSASDLRTRGLKTAERVLLLPASTAPSALSPSNATAREYRAFYYDTKGRVCQIARFNVLGGTDRISSGYGFAGNLLNERQRIQPGSGQSYYTLDRYYSYDSHLRLQSVCASLNGGTSAQQTLSYDDLQRVNAISRSSGCSESTQLSYTLQGWLSSSISTSWEETLYYASPAHGATDIMPGKAGLVTEWSQQQNGTASNGATTKETFAFSYDKAGRLLNSERYLGTSSSSDNCITEKSIGYDRSGNLTSLVRYDSGGSVAETLSYSYSGPKRTTWSYDAHANVTSDPQAGLSLAWNVRDLPRTLSSSSASTQRDYLADGVLAQIYDGTNTRLYLGDMVFNKSSNGTVSLESAGWEGGRLLAGTGADKTLYYVTDHVGSIRVVKDGAGNVRQRFDYYPYGAVSRVWTSSSTTDNSEKRYRFEGKEIAGSALTDLAGVGTAPGAPYFDFGARLYAPRTATWLSPDPLAERYYGHSPYLFCAANPVRFVDPTGTDWYKNDTDTENLYYWFSGDLEREGFTRIGGEGSVLGSFEQHLNDIMSSLGLDGLYVNGFSFRLADNSTGAFSSDASPGLFKEFVYNIGPEITIFNDYHPYTRELKNLHEVKALQKDILTGRNMVDSRHFRTGTVDWGLLDIIPNIQSEAREFIGSFRYYGYMNSSLGIDNIIFDSKSRHSLFLHLSKNKPREECSLLGNTYQFYIWKSSGR